MKPKFFFAILVLTGLAAVLNAQSLVIPHDLNLPKDSIARNQLIASLNGFMAQIENANSKNAYVLKTALPETSALLDEMKGMQKNAKLKDDNFYKCTLAGVVGLTPNDYVVKLQYTGVEGNIAKVRAAFTLFAKLQDGRFYFYSPLRKNAAAWKIMRMGYITYHFKDTITAVYATSYRQMVNRYDKTLMTAGTPTDVYVCDNFPEAQQLLGVDYKLDYNGKAWDVFTAHENNAAIVVNGWNNYQVRFDPHDLWHERLRMVADAATINRPVDEGCAYLFGGSWGIPWTDVLTMFKKYVAENPNADWQKLYLDNKNFADGDKPLKISYMINALIVQKIDREKGFSPIMSLLTCGTRQPGDENYFKALEKTSGVNKANFNSEVAGLIKGTNRHKNHE